MDTDTNTDPHKETWENSKVCTGVARCMEEDVGRWGYYICMARQAPRVICGGDSYEWFMALTQHNGG